jgi:hypothetical protein
MYYLGINMYSLHNYARVIHLHQNTGGGLLGGIPLGPRLGLGH